MLSPKELAMPLSLAAATQAVVAASAILSESPARHSHIVGYDTGMIDTYTSMLRAQLLLVPGAII